MLLKTTQNKVTKIATAKLPTRFGNFVVHAFQDEEDPQAEHLAIVMGEELFSEQTPLVRIHSECLTGDLLGSLRCDCGFQLHHALEQIANSGSGAVVYLRNHEGRGIGLHNKMRAYEHQDQGMDTVEANLHLGFEADERSYKAAAKILKALNINELNLLTNNPRKHDELEQYNIKVHQRISIVAGVLPDNKDYLKTKQDKLDHLLHL